MMQSIKDLLKRVENWPEQDQQELAEVIRDIEARRTGAYHATPEELQAIDEALGQMAPGEVENDPRFLRRIDKARRSLRAGRGVRLEDV